jgi:RNA polymerase subunit RPABC4/transcription elongation factor Spt4
MTEKTMQGKKCPKCKSFVRDDSSGCSVCGFEWAKKTTGAQTEKVEELPTAQPEKETSLPGSMACPKCGTENSSDFRYCKICKHP